MVSNFSDDLAEFIKDELYDGLFYTAMAEIAPDSDAKQILLQIADEENSHAKNLMREFYRLTGKNYQAKNDFEEIPPFRNALTERIKVEIHGFKTYYKQSLNAPNRILGNLFSETAAEEAEHAMLLLMLLSESITT